MNTENLKKGKATQFGSGDERAKRAQAKGGKASGEARRKKTSMQRTWNIIKSMPLKSRDQDDIAEIRSIADMQGANITVEEAMILAMTKKAASGDVRAFEALSKFTDQNRAAQLAQRAAELANKKAKLEIEQLEMQVHAYKSALETAESSQVVILDDIPDDEAD